MTMRQHTAWAQVCHLWANGGMVEGEIGYVLLSEEEKRNKSESDTMTWIWT